MSNVTSDGKAKGQSPKSHSLPEVWKRVDLSVMKKTFAYHFLFQGEV